VNHEQGELSTMDEMSAFVSVGGAATDQQETFIRAIEQRLLSEGIIPHTVGRNTFSADAPLKTVIELLDKCSGAVVIALERFYFPSGIEKRGGPGEKKMSEPRFRQPGIRSKRLWHTAVVFRS
jgi:hypothetical protein